MLALNLTLEDEDTLTHLLPKGCVGWGLEEGRKKACYQGGLQGSRGREGPCTSSC